MDVRAVAVASLLVATLLLALVPYPATFVGPGESADYYEHRVAPASSQAYDAQMETIRDEGANESELRHVAYDDLSPTARELFDRALDRPPSDDGAHAVEPIVCRDGAYLCPGYDREDLPEEFEYATDRQPEAVALVVERGDERHLYSTSGLGLQSRHGSPGLALLLFAGISTLAIGAGFVAGAGAGHVLSSLAGRVATVVLGATVFSLPFTDSVPAAAADAPSFLILAVGLSVIAYALTPSPRSLRSRKWALGCGVGLVVAVLVVPYVATVFRSEPAFFAAIGAVLLGWVAPLVHSVAAVLGRFDPDRGRVVDGAERK